MRTRLIKTVGVFFLLASANIFAADLSSHEQTCADLGFKKRTPAYGDCVLELDRRGRTQSNSQAAQEAERQREEQQRQAQEQQRAAAARGDGSPDHQTCAGFGFVAGTTPYSDCRMRIAIAKREAQQRQAAFEADQQRYEAERREYDAKVAAQERQRKVDAWLKSAQFFSALGAGQSRNFSENAANAGRIVSGQPPLPPTQPQIQNFTITGPSGRMTSCTAMGNHVNCF